MPRKNGSRKTMKNDIYMDHVTPSTQPLYLEMYQRIHTTALQRAARGLYPKAVPAHIDIEALKRHAHQAGVDGYLMHPTDIKQIFAGVTLESYQMIERLYCS